MDKNSLNSILFALADLTKDWYLRVRSYDDGNAEIILVVKVDFVQFVKEMLNKGYTFTSFGAQRGIFTYGDSHIMFDFVSNVISTWEDDSEKTNGG